MSKPRRYPVSREHSVGRVHMTHTSKKEETYKFVLNHDICQDQGIGASAITERRSKRCNVCRRPCPREAIYRACFYASMRGYKLHGFELLQANLARWHHQRVQDKLSERR